ncbi:MULTISPECIES: hypothetical protein [unclassified Marinobacter]|uniref:hypothetical protein n=1 Tax=unclassified Marinobacter TaxID=83889 RepID=UPI000BF9CB21|nr:MULTISPECIES: hypothetical protein [unclassified Marinobacter]PFG09517.1 hypothetical protein ATI45_1899 [Marinobacter sp. LV10MA510-1]PFG51423.1 hypothetical protein ATG98_0359 [Marinobacter sp. LV10R520-4]
MWQWRGAYRLFWRWLLPLAHFRLRFDPAPAALLTTISGKYPEANSEAGSQSKNISPITPTALPLTPADEALNVAPDTHIPKQVREERNDATSEDLLDDARPVK